MMFKKIIFLPLAAALFAVAIPAAATIAGTNHGDGITTEDPPGEQSVKPLPAPVQQLPSTVGTFNPAVLLPGSTPTYATIPEMIAGRIPGVLVTGNIGFYRIRIRNAAAPPMLVIDQMRFPDLSDRELNDLLLSVHPGDVGYIEVLRSLADTMFYGPFGNNGVIIIRTMLPEVASGR